jgi:hypothetical protein
MAIAFVGLPMWQRPPGAELVTGPALPARQGLASHGAVEPAGLSGSTVRRVEHDVIRSRLG